MSVRVGAVEIDHVAELTIPTSVRWMLPDALREEVEPHRSWMQPHFMDEAGRLVQSIHPLLLRSDELTILVDTGVGNGKDRTGGIPAFHMLDLPWLDRLAACGVQPEDVDLVLHTHLHGDHCGWNTRREGQQWVPTFSNARYLIVDREWEHWSRAAAGDPATARLIEDSVRPVFEAGLVDLVAADHEVSEAIRFVPSHGHTPGHVTIEVRSAGESAALIGDVMHTPLQCAFPTCARRSTGTPSRRGLPGGRCWSATRTARLSSSGRTSRRRGVSGASGARTGSMRPVRRAE